MCRESSGFGCTDLDAGVQDLDRPTSKERGTSERESWINLLVRYGLGHKQFFPVIQRIKTKGK